MNFNITARVSLFVIFFAAVAAISITVIFPAAAFADASTEETAFYGYDRVKWGADANSVKSEYGIAKETAPSEIFGNYTKLENAPSGENNVIKKRIFTFDDGKLFFVQLFIDTEKAHPGAIVEKLTDKYGRVTAGSGSVCFARDCSIRALYEWFPFSGTMKVEYSRENGVITYCVTEKMRRFMSDSDRREFLTTHEREMKKLEGF